MKIKTTNFLVILVAFLSIGTVLNAQERRNTGSYITGIVIDNDSKEPIIGATVVIDSTTKGDVTNAKGIFTLRKLKAKKQINIVVSFIGYESESFSITPKRGINTQPTINLRPKAVSLDDVIVRGTAPISIQKGDTTQYNAGAYKTNPDASAEDLVNKMPGFSSENGTLSVGGEEVTQVYVDGKSYFKNEVVDALNSLPANIVESIQLFDEKSDNARFTGVDDGDRAKTINIVTTIKKRNAYIGDYILGGGYSIANNNSNLQNGTDKGVLYNIKTNTNIFQNNNRFTVSFGSNNINQNAMQGNRYYGRSNSSGLKEASGFRFNYSGDYKKAEFKHTKIGVSYNVENTQTELIKMLNRSFFEVDSKDEELYTEAYAANSNGDSHRTFFNVESDLNENNKINIRGWGRFTDAQSFQKTEAESSIDNNPTNSAITDINNDNNSYNIGTRALWLHRLTEKHSISVKGNFSLSNSTGDQLLIGKNSTFIEELQLADEEELNQTTSNINGNNDVGVELRYTYNLNNKSGISLNYQSSYNWSEVDKKTFLYDETTNSYIDIDETLSNVFDRDYFTNELDALYSYNIKDKVNFTGRLGVKNSELKNNQTFPTSNLFEKEYSFNSLNTYAQMNYYFSKNKRFNLYMRGNSNLPSVSQLQDVVNNTNPLLITTGNSNLEQSYNLALGTHYYYSNPTNSTSFNAYFFGSNETNYIANKTRLLTKDEIINGVLVQKGARVSSPVNADGLWRANMGASYSIPLKKILCNLTIGGRYNYSQIPSFINNESSFSRENRGSISLKLNSNITENLDFTLSSNTSLSVASNTINDLSDNTYIRENIGIKTNWIIYKGFFVNVDYSYNFFHYSNNEPAAPNFSMLNAGIGKKFFKKQNLELRLSGFDLLNQSQALSHIVSAEYIEDSRSNVLQRYLMLSLAYKFNTMKGRKDPSSSNTKRGNRHRNSHSSYMY